MAQYSGHYLLDLMSEEDQQKFKINFQFEYDEYASGAYGDFSNQPTLEDHLNRAWPRFDTFLLGAFYWSITPEGYDYWANVAKTKIK
jgi:hypothetical protein